MSHLLKQIAALLLASGVLALPQGIVDPQLATGKDTPLAGSFAGNFPRRFDATIINLFDKCISVVESPTLSDIGALNITACDLSNRFQQFDVVELPEDPAKVFIASQGNNGCLTFDGTGANGTGIITKPCTGSRPDPNQLWNLLRGQTSTRLDREVGPELSQSGRVCFQVSEVDTLIVRDCEQSDQIFLIGRDIIFPPPAEN